MVFIVLAVVLVPSIFIGMALFDEATSFYGHISSGQANGAGFFSIVQTFIESEVSVFAPKIPINIGEYLKNIASWFAESRQFLFKFSKDFSGRASYGCFFVLFLETW